MLFTNALRHRLRLALCPLIYFHAQRREDPFPSSCDPETRLGYEFSDYRVIEFGPRSIHLALLPVDYPYARKDAAKVTKAAKQLAR
ncbi:hypothetical protein [Bradyrhizobium yuanmingense]|uniref:hypothetical protein n=1 Tax=Bradyrhizobium yuanmingense TaxID=108015 RepID=UPI0023B946DE|nr:hypothetical protein [Bradyrhizobium yuanmingense]MDF0582067.1 hypothetical protein [Bradyrhizobium yuanmingense]